MTDLNYFKILFDVGYPIWVIAGGGLLCVILDTFFPKRGGGMVFAAGVLVLGYALYAAFQQWLGANLATQDLLVNDKFTLFFTFLVILIGILSLFNSYAYLMAHEKLSGEMVSLILFSIVGMIFLFASDHLVVNFIGLETMSLAIYVMVGSNKRDLRSNEAALKYYIMGSVASAFLLYGIALMYGSFGTFRLTDLAKMQLYPGLVYLPRIALTLLLSGVLFKLALVPFHFWVPDVYQGAPTPVTGFMATGVKVAVFALFIRVITSLNYLPEHFSNQLLLFCVVASLLVGNLGALIQDNVKRMLAYSSISHAGFLFLGLYIGLKEGQFDPSVAMAVLFYLLAYSLTSLGAFGVLSVMIDKKQEATNFSDLEGLAETRPGLALLLSLFMISLLGIPATAGFSAKYGVLSLAVKNGHVSLAIFGVLMSVVSVAYYLRPIVVMYFKEAPKLRRSFIDAPIPFFLMFSMIFTALAVLYLGIFPDSYLQLAHLAVSVLK